MKDLVIPKGKWEFDENVTRVFDDMLARSIPDYIGMRELTTNLAIKFAKSGTDIVDLGCSRGAGLKPIYEKLKEEVKYLGVEVSKPMRKAAEKEIPFAEIIDLDLRKSYPRTRASVTLSVLTLQFIPIEYRQEIIQNVYENTNPGGVFILVEKVLGSDAYCNKLLIDTFLKTKESHGYSKEQIERKRESLEGVLVPVTADWNVELLREAGFKHIDCYWRHLNFAGWVAIKE
jgi:tRNA (cmo5U34)-methyltransferase